MYKLTPEEKTTLIEEMVKKNVEDGGLPTRDMIDMVCEFLLQKLRDLTPSERVEDIEILAILQDLLDEYDGLPKDTGILQAIDLQLYIDRIKEKIG